MSEWQPIESAPKDGTEFLAWIKTCAGGRVATVEWCDRRWVESYDLAGWMPEYGPTHWMPLPDPPASGIETEGQDPQGLGAEHESPTAEGGTPKVSR